MPVQLRVHFLPDLTTPEALSGATVVVIDILRASSTIVEALANGAREVIPCLEVEDARRAADALPGGEVRLGGERGGLPIDGFDFGNSPAEYTAKAIAGRTVVFTTTNGTRAMMRCTKAARVLIGGFVNQSAVLRELSAAESIQLVCAGTRGEITREDVLFAGSLVQQLTIQRPMDYACNDQAILAREAWQAAVTGPGTDEQVSPHVLANILSNTQGGRNLLAIGLERDIQDVARIDRHNLTAELDLAAWRICAAPR